MNEKNRMEEEWRDVAGYEGLYEVSDLGAVRSHYGGKVKYLKCIKDKDGYLHLKLCKNGKSKKFFAHRIVYEAFNGPVPEGMQLDHINTVRDDNRLENLRAVTPKENCNNPVTRVRHLEAIKKLTSSEEWRNRQREGAKKLSENQEWRNNVRKAAKRRAENPQLREKMRECARKALSKPVIQLDVKTSEVIRRWECAADAWRELGINYGHISECCYGKRNVAGGFRWKFA